MSDRKTIAVPVSLIDALKEELSLSGSTAAVLTALGVFLRRTGRWDVSFNVVSPGKRGRPQIATVVERTVPPFTVVEGGQVEG